MTVSPPLSRSFAVLVFVTLLLAHGCASRPKERSRGSDESRVKVRVGRVHLEQGNYAEAVVKLNEAIRLDPQNADARYFLGITHFYARDYSRAEAALRETLRLDPKRTDVHNYLGAVYSEMHDLPRALAEYQLALADPDYRTPELVWLNLAKLHDEGGKPDEALADLRRAVERNPKFYRGHYEMGVLLDRMERTQEAIQEFEIAAPQYAASPDYHYRLGLAYFRAGQHDRAREHLTKVVASLPGSESAQKAREFLDLIDATPVGQVPGPGARRPSP